MSLSTDQARELGETLRGLRQDRGISQEELAHRAGITKNQVQLLEAGRASGRKESVGPSNPRLSTLQGIALGLDIKLSDLLSRSGL